MLQSNECYKVINDTKNKRIQTTKYYTMLQGCQCYIVVNVTKWKCNKLKMIQIENETIDK